MTGNYSMYRRGSSGKNDQNLFLKNWEDLSCFDIGNLLFSGVKADEIRKKYVVNTKDILIKIRLR